MIYFMSCLPMAVRIVLASILALSLIIGAESLCAEDPSVVIKAQDGWANVFGETNAKMRFDVTSTVALAAVVRWSYSANGRTIANGESMANAEPGQSTEVVVPLQFPAVKDAVIFTTKLSLSVSERNVEPPLATITTPIWIFPRDPFLDRSRWLQQLEITLFDPVGDTAQVFTDASIPFMQTRNLATLSELNRGLLVIGEGVSLTNNRSLSAALYSAAARGLPVLCLAPSDGVFAVPGADVDATIPQFVTFRRGDVISELDKRLDAKQWLPAREPVTSGLRYHIDRNRMVLEVSDSAQGWPWLETKYNDTGVFVICGFGIIKHWHDGPTPRFLLTRILEHLTNEPNDLSHPNH